MWANHTYAHECFDLMSIDDLALLIYAVSMSSGTTTERHIFDGASLPKVESSHCDNPRPKSLKRKQIAHQDGGKQQYLQIRIDQ